VISSKLLGVTSITSDASSAMATVTRARAVRDRRREENFMTEGGREGEMDPAKFSRDIYGSGSPPTDKDVADHTWPRLDGTHSQTAGAPSAADTA
jgi:hypothetical protein